MIIIFEFLNILCTLGIGISGYAINNLEISARTWFSLLIVMPILSLPLILLGIAISLLKDSDTINAVTNLIIFPMAIASGLWWPISLLPNWLQQIGKLMPTYFISNIATDLIKHKSFSTNSILALLIWTIVIALIIEFTIKLSQNRDFR